MSEREDRYYTEGFRGSMRKFMRIKDEVNDVYMQTIKPVFVALHGEEEAKRMARREAPRAIFSESDVSAVLLHDSSSRKIVGFTYATPAPEFKTGVFSNSNIVYEEEMLIKQYSLDELNALQRNTVEVGWTTILEEHRGKGGLGMMMDNLEEQVLARGFEYHARFVRVDNGYAEKLKHRYDGQVVFERSFDDPTFMGEQLYFRAKLR
jgi:hypothetical protein